MNTERNMQVHIAPSGYANHVARTREEDNCRQHNRRKQSSTEGAKTDQRERQEFPDDRNSELHDRKKESGKVVEDLKRNKKTRRESERP